MLRSSAVAAIALAGLVHAAPVHAAYLYWSKVQVSSAEESHCYSFARTAARDALSNVRFSPGQEVAGSQGRSYAAITCVGRGGNRAETVIAVRQTVEGLLARGYRFVTVDELLGVPAYQT